MRETLLVTGVWWVGRTDCTTVSQRGDRQTDQLSNVYIRGPEETVCHTTLLTANKSGVSV